jgi:hypothetical protein
MPDAYCHKCDVYTVDQNVTNDNLHDACGTTIEYVDNFYCADCDRCGTICDLQCSSCRKSSQLGECNEGNNATP